jgi:hypothetical protein
MVEFGSPEFETELPNSTLVFGPDANSALITSTISVRIAFSSPAGSLSKVLSQRPHPTRALPWRPEVLDEHYIGAKTWDPSAHAE